MNWHYGISRKKHRIEIVSLMSGIYGRGCMVNFDIININRRGLVPMGS